MLTELAVRDLGVIDDLRLVLGPGMTALTGETGAGKTLVVEAIELLVGGRAEGVLVRRGADEARVEGRFVSGDEERPLFRVAAAPDDGVMSLHAKRPRHRARLNDGGEADFVVHPIDDDVQERCGEKHRAHCMARRGGRPRPPAARQRGFAAQADEGVRLSYGSLRPCCDAAPDRAQP